MEEEPKEQEIGETEEERLSEIELGTMEEYKARDKESGLSLVHIMTPAEHLLIGSTCPGQAFHPNLPTAMAGGASLEEVNQARESSTDTLLVRVVEHRGTPRATLYRVDFRMLPLREEQTRKQELDQTFVLTTVKIEVGPGEGTELELDDKIRGLVQARIDHDLANSSASFIKHYGPK